MEFWGTEVALGKAQLVEPPESTYVHVSQAALGPNKDGKQERVVIRVETDGKNIVLGTLVQGTVDQMALDLIFDRDFTLSHNSSSSSVFFCGYMTEKGQDWPSEEDSEDDEEDEEAVPVAVPVKANGTISAVKETAKEIAKAAKQGKGNAEAAGAVAEVQTPKEKVKKSSILKSGLIDQEAIEDEGTDEDDDDEDDDEGANLAVKMDFDSDDYDEEDDVDFEGGDFSGDESDDDDDDDDIDASDEDSDDDEEEEGASPEVGKKRSLKASAKSPTGGKKARVDTPARPGLIAAPGKKAGAKGAAAAKLTPVSKTKEAVLKTPVKTPGKVVSAKTPKTASPGGESAKKPGSHHCAECSRNFASDSALSQHSLAKHKK